MAAGHVRGRRALQGCIVVCLAVPLSRLRTGIWICYTMKIRGFVVLLTRVQARIETIQIAAHRSFFAVLTLSRDVNGSIVGAGVRK